MEATDSLEITSKTPSQEAVFLSQFKRRVENELLRQIDALENYSDDLIAAMRYSLLNGGKRLRSALIYSLEEVFLIEPVVLDSIAAAIECIHASSLIHDDLPALDDDHLRRGKPACHIAFNEAIAILAGDALLNLSHQIILSLPQEKISATDIVQIANVLAKAIGTSGMMGGQAMEFDSQSAQTTTHKIIKLYELKTAALLAAGCEMALIVAKASPETMQGFKAFAYHLGLSFQILDDILDIESNTEQMGKPQHSDAKSDKATLIQHLGLDKAKEMLAHHQQQVHDIMHTSTFKSQTLTQLIEYMMKRKF